MIDPAVHSPAGEEPHPTPMRRKVAKKVGFPRGDVVRPLRPTLPFGDLPRSPVWASAIGVGLPMLRADGRRTLGRFSCRCTCAVLCTVLRGVRRSAQSAIRPAPRSWENRAASGVARSSLQGAHDDCDHTAKGGPHAASLPRRVRPRSIGSPTPIADAQTGDRGRSPKGRVGRRGRTTSPRGKPTFLSARRRPPRRRCVRRAGTSRRRATAACRLREA